MHKRDEEGEGCQERYNIGRREREREREGEREREKGNMVQIENDT